MIKVRIAAVSTKAQKVLKVITGTTNPAYTNPLKVNLVIFICVTNTVKTYRIIEFVKKEKSPKVIILKGREKIFKIGFRINKSKESTKPAIT